MDPLLLVHTFAGLLAFGASLPAGPTTSPEISPSPAPHLPNSSLDCLSFRLNRHWDFIEWEYRRQRFFSENTQECLAYVNDPEGYMKKFNDRTPYIPKQKYECRDRLLLRRMDIMSMVQEKPDNMIERTMLCEVYFDNLRQQREFERSREKATEERTTKIIVGGVCGIILILLCCLAGWCRSVKRQAACRDAEIRIADLVPQQRDDELDQTGRTEMQLAVQAARENDLGWGSQMNETAVPQPERPPNTSNEAAPPPSYEEATNTA